MSKLFKRDFTMVVIGQIISLFRNAILWFALPLYLLRETDEPIIVERSEESKIENFSSYFGIEKEPKIEKERGADLIDVSKEVRPQWRL